MTIGERIVELRKERDWSQAELARRAGVSKSYLHQLENGSVPSVDKAHDIAKALGVWVSHLTGEIPIPDDSAHIIFTKALASGYLTFCVRGDEYSLRISNIGDGIAAELSHYDLRCLKAVIDGELNDDSVWS